MSKFRVCVRVIPQTLGIGIHRIARALARYAPGDVELVDEPTEADMLIVHAIGHGSMELLNTYKGPYAMVQYCLRTTEDARPEAWTPYWENAKVVWSYYDLASFIDPTCRGAAPGMNILTDQGSKEIAFYYAPLGVDGEIFKPIQPARKRFLIGTSGYVAETEGVRECYNAARKLEQPMFHLGPDLGIGPGIVNAHRISDVDVAQFWSLCSFVAGLRRIEGFELPAIEALACGSRPVCFDAPHYTNWFGEHAEYIPEADADTVTQHLIELFSKPIRPVTNLERQHVLHKFNWQSVAQGFWEALR